MAIGVSELDALINGLDHDGLVRYVDGCCSSRDWTELLRVRDTCRLANDSGRQMWPITTLANYRLALHAPAEFAVQSLDEANTNFLFGPLSEVIAQHHSWDDLKGHLSDVHIADVVAHECGIRGADISYTPTLQVFDIPHTLQSWENQYQPPVYTDAGVQHDPPEFNGELQPLEIAAKANVVEDRDTTSALRAVIEPWISASNGRAEIRGVEGGVSEALASIGAVRARGQNITPADAISLITWAGSSGGAHGRRRGMASGRYSMWWCVVALAGLTDEWPLKPDEIGDITSEFTWWQWDAYEPRSGWRLQIAVEDPTDGVTWIINAVDTAI